MFGLAAWAVGMATPGQRPVAPAGRSHGANQERQGQQGGRIRHERERKVKAKWERSSSKLPPLKYFRHMKNKALCPVIQGAEPSGKLPASKRTPLKMRDGGCYSCINTTKHETPGARNTAHRGFRLTILGSSLGRVPGSIRGLLQSRVGPKGPWATPDGYYAARSLLPLSHRCRRAKASVVAVTLS